MAVLAGITVISAFVGMPWRLRAPLHIPRAGYAAGVLQDAIVIAGGSYWADGKKIRTSRVDVYRPACDCWQEAASMPARLAGTATAIADGKMYVFGGNSDKGAVSDVFSFDGKVWKREATMTLPEPRTNAMAVAIHAETLVVFGGMAEADAPESGSSTGWTWNIQHPEKGWKPLPTFPGKARSSAAIAAEEHEFVIAGGLAASNPIENLGDVWRFNLMQRKWYPGPDLPEGRRAFSALATPTGIVFAGGYVTGFRGDILWMHDNKITKWADLAEKVADAPLLDLNGYWYIAGGEVGPKLRGSHTWAVKAGGKQ